MLGATAAAALALVAVLAWRPAASATIGWPEGERQGTYGPSSGDGLAVRWTPLDALAGGGRAVVALPDRPLTTVVVIVHHHGNGPGWLPGGGPRTSRQDVVDQVSSAAAAEPPAVLVLPQGDDKAWFGSDAGFRARVLDALDAVGIAESAVRSVAVTGESGGGRAVTGAVLAWGASQPRLALAEWFEGVNGPNELAAAIRLAETPPPSCPVMTSVVGRSGSYAERYRRLEAAIAGLPWASVRWVDAGHASMVRTERLLERSAAWLRAALAEPPRCGGGPTRP